jgi:thiol:disulfide interchange protein DsbA
VIAALAIGAASASAADKAADKAAAAPAYELNKQYALVKEMSPAPNAKRVLVQEFFWYGCPHCYEYDPTMLAWLAKKPADVDFERVPASLGRAAGEVHQRAFYIAKTLGVDEKIHTPLFNAIHREHLPMVTIEQVRDFFVATTGMKPAEFDGVAFSFPVESEMHRADALATSYAITAVPTLAVGGKYLTDGVRAGSLTQVPKVLDFLIVKVREEQASAAKKP